MSEPGFEGIEKKIKVDFRGGSLRSISRDILDSMLDAAKCTIMSKKSNSSFDSYVLSESSLFVYPDHIMIKTCGTTRLLEALPILLQAAKAVDAEAVNIEFTHSNFMFPTSQIFPHTSFEHEVDWLDKMFAGSAHIMGPVKGARWHIYHAPLVSPLPSLPVRQEVCLEIMMFKLDRTKMKQFFKSTSTGPEITRSSGIVNLLPDYDIDEQLFEPCGYSCNGLDGDKYMTIHVTPEEGFSFVSFETNTAMDDYTPLVERVLACFKPGAFGISLLVHGGVESYKRCTWTFADFANKGTTTHHFENGSDVTVAHFGDKCPSVPAATKPISPYSPYSLERFSLQRAQSDLQKQNSDIAETWSGSQRLFIGLQLMTLCVVVGIVILLASEPRVVSL